MLTHFLNGIDVVKLSETSSLFRQNPQLGNFSFCAESDWVDGGHTKVKIQRFSVAGNEDESRSEAFVIECDEPDQLLGNNNAPNPSEMILAALTSCLSVGFIYNASARGIKVESLKFLAEGDLNITGFLGISKDVRPGYQNIRVSYQVKSSATDEELKDLLTYVQATSPVLDMLRNASSVSLQLVNIDKNPIK